MLLHIYKRELSDSLARNKYNAQPDILAMTLSGVGMWYRRCSNVNRSYAESPRGGLKGGGVFMFFLLIGSPLSRMFLQIASFCILQCMMHVWCVMCMCAKSARKAAMVAPNKMMWYLLHPVGPKVFIKCVQKVPERCKKLDGRCCKTYFCKNVLAKPSRSRCGDDSSQWDHEIFASPRWPKSFQ